MRKIHLIIFFFLIAFTSVKAQINYNTEADQKITLKFYIPKIEATANQSFFNILIIRNNSDKKFTGSIKLSEPAGWQIVGEAEQNITLNANDSLKLPVRAIVSNNVLGEVAYSLVASLYNSENLPIQSEYCFINIPRIGDLKIKAPNDILYFDNKTKTATINYSISNKGNTNEIIQINVFGNEGILVNKQALDPNYAEEISLPAHSDTIVEIDVQLEKELAEDGFYSLDINTFTQDSLYKDKIWFNKINNISKNVIPEDYKCAIIEFMALDLFSVIEPKYAVMAKGWVLLKKNTDIYYYYRNNDIKSKWDDYYNTRFNLGIKSNNYKLLLGTFDNLFDQYILGIGGHAELNYNNQSLQGFYLSNNPYMQSFYGGAANFNFKQFNQLGFGYAQNNIGLEKNYTDIYYGSLGFRFLKKNNFLIQAYFNKTSHEFGVPFETIGYSILSDYYAKFNKLNIQARLNYNSPDYSGTNRGRFKIDMNVRYSLNKISSLIANYSKSDDYNLTYVNDSALPLRIRLYDDYQLYYNRIINNNLSLAMGTIFRAEGYNSPYIKDYPGLMFRTLNNRFFISGNYKFSYSSTTLNPRFDFGTIRIIEADSLEKARTVAYPTFNFNLSFHSKDFGLYLQFKNGPWGIYEQYFYYKNPDHFFRNLFLSPSYHKYLFNNLMKLDFYVNYRKNITTNESDLALSPQLNIFLPNSWSMRFLSTNTIRTSKDRLTGSAYRYTSSYFEVTLRKEFNCNQPRYQYHNLEVVFFKDLNGNRVREPNEPGLRNVLATVEPDITQESQNNKNQATSKLLTGDDGVVSYKNIVNGLYNIKYLLIGDMVGNFNREELSQSITVDQDKVVYIPYLENNRIVGKVILNRDPLSSFGTIDISNIRVLAEDTQGHTYSALTDKMGNFVLYTPVTDHYIVKINNIFYESFDLQQSEFIVKFNGYKQFEVTFVFSEKKRKISFNNEVTKDDFKMDELKAIRKTTLSGKIRDAISLEPVEAKIKIIDNTTNKVVSEAISNRLNGNYSISYVAGDKFRIEIKSEGYWDHQENLYIEQVISIQNIAKDLMLNKLSDGPNNQTFIIYDEKEEKDFTQNFKSGQKIPINNLNFNEKETRLSPNAYPELDRLIELLNKNKSVKIEVAGHADDTGKERIDNLLAQRRAESVQKYLTTHGLTEDRIRVKSYSNSRPLVPGNTDEAKQKNRRVEITVL